MARRGARSSTKKAPSKEMMVKRWSWALAIAEDLEQSAAAFGKEEQQHHYQQRIEELKRKLRDAGAIPFSAARKS
jgi:transcription elongation GreA/GreB family factor